MDKILFSQICNKIKLSNLSHDGIGVLNEKTLHAVLKNYLEPHKENHEIKIGSFVADILGEKGIIEIQTSNFSKLRKKLTPFLNETTVTVVYPIAKVKWLYWIDTQTGEITTKRRSTKTGNIYDLTHELVFIRDLLAHPNLIIMAVFLEIAEYRYLDGWSKDKKKGSTRCDKIPMALCDEIIFERAEDYKILLPAGLNDSFTAKEFSKLTKLKPRPAHAALSVMCSVGIIEHFEMRGRAFLYRRK